MAVYIETLLPVWRHILLFFNMVLKKFYAHFFHISLDLGGCAQWFGVSDRAELNFSLAYTNIFRHIINIIQNNTARYFAPLNSIICIALGMLYGYSYI